MLRRTPTRCAVLLLLAVAVMPLGLSQATASEPSERPVGSVIITGAIQQSVLLTFEELQALPLTPKSLTVMFRSGATLETHDFTGFLLFDVLNLLKPKLDSTVKNDKLRFYVSATATDDYQATVAWGELDPDFGNKQILLALTQDVQSLATQGPRLVVPGDVRGGRYVSGVETIRLDRA